MNVRTQVIVRPLEAADVSAILGIISGCRREYGLEGRVDSILERADYEILDVYQRERSRYFVAVIGGDIAGGGWHCALRRRRSADLRAAADVSSACE